MSAASAEGLLIAHVSKQFAERDGLPNVLDDLSLSVPRGAFATLIGPSGCGKTTLLRIAAGLLPADEGTVLIFGKSAADAASGKQIGFVPQSPALLPWRTALQNVRLPLQVNKRPRSTISNGRADPAGLLRAFGLGEVLHRYPEQLSGGMRQRVALARALVFDPAVLLMDEPFSALDELTREAQRHHLLEVWQANRKTVLFVTHSVTEAVTLSDLVFVMSAQPGRVRSVIPVDLPRPRHEDVELSEDFRDVERCVRLELRGAQHAGERPAGPCTDQRAHE